MNLWASVSVQKAGPWCVSALIIAILHKLTDTRSEKMLETVRALVSNDSPVRDSAAGVEMSEAVNCGATDLLNTITRQKDQQMCLVLGHQYTFLVSRCLEYDFFA